VLLGVGDASLVFASSIGGIGPVVELEKKHAKKE
jgi:hypothetical protein